MAGARAPSIFRRRRRCQTSRFHHQRMFYDPVAGEVIDSWAAAPILRLNWCAQSEIRRSGLRKTGCAFCGPFVLPLCLDSRSKRHLAGVASQRRCNQEISAEESGKNWCGFSSHPIACAVGICWMRVVYCCSSAGSRGDEGMRPTGAVSSEGDVFQHTRLMWIVAKKFLCRSFFRSLSRYRQPSTASVDEPGVFDSTDTTASERK